MCYFSELLEIKSFKGLFQLSEKWFKRENIKWANHCNKRLIIKPVKCEGKSK